MRSHFSVKTGILGRCGTPVIVYYRIELKGMKKKSLEVLYLSHTKETNKQTKKRKEKKTKERHILYFFSYGALL